MKTQPQTPKPCLVKLDDSTFVRGQYVEVEGRRYARVTVADIPLEWFERHDDTGELRSGEWLDMHSTDGVIIDIEDSQEA